MIMTKNELLIYKIEKCNNKREFKPINSEQEEKLMFKGYRKLSDENISIVYDINSICDESLIDNSNETINDKNSNNAQFLKEIGFLQVGRWINSHNDNNRIDFEIDTKYLDQNDLLYAFESNDIIYYIGKTDKSLKERMGNYKAGKQEGKGGSTNKIVHKKILELLQKVSYVNIMVMQNELDYNYNGLRISLASGLEMSLISYLNSDFMWNSRGNTKKSIKNALENTSTSSGIIPNQSMLKLFEIKLGKEYYEKGIISIPAKYKDFLPKESGVTVKVEIDNNELITSTFTLSGENRKINGKAPLKRWFKNNFQPHDKIKVQIISSLHYKVSKI
jgi:hypothetical protein